MYLAPSLSAILQKSKIRDHNINSESYRQQELDSYFLSM